MKPLTARRWATSVGLFVLMAAAAGAVALWMGDVPLTETILMRHRLPRVVQGLLVGTVLGMSGAVLQGLLRNPLADPFILGVSGGGALGTAAVALLPGLGALVAEPVGGFIGALAALLVVTGLATRDGRARPLDMLLTGVVFNAFAGAMLMVLQVLGRTDALKEVVLKLMGTLDADPSRPWLAWLLGGSVVVLAATAVPNARRLDVLVLGDDTAKSLGVDPDRLRLVLFVGLSLPIGLVVAVTGMIGFVGLIVPHGVRLLLGPQHRLLLPASALAGAVFVVLCDGLVRMLSGPLGTELPVGVVTATLGGPVFLVLLRRGRASHGEPEP